MKTPLKLLRNTQKFRRSPKGILTNIYSHQKSRFPVEYTLKQLHHSFLFNEKFLRLFLEWEKKNYDKQYKPTIDRIDCKKHYTLTNIHCLTWAENRYKQRMEFKRIRAKEVKQIMGNKIIKRYKSVSHAVKETGLNQSGISLCLHGRRQFCGGYKWSY